MNERIRRAARESHLDVYGLGKDRAKWEATLELFTQLIVRDCAHIIDTKDPRDTPAPHLYLLKRFGIDDEKISDC